MGPTRRRGWTKTVEVHATAAAAAAAAAAPAAASMALGASSYNEMPSEARSME